MNRISKLEKDNLNFATNFVTLQAEVKNNSACISSIIKQISTTGYSSDAAILEEVENRLSRPKNILVFGISESTKVLKKEREES